MLWQHSLTGSPTGLQVNVHNMISTDAHAAAATEQNSTQQNSIVTKVKNTIKQARANLIPLLIGGAAALLLHNHLPVLKRTLLLHVLYRLFCTHLLPFPGLQSVVLLVAASLCSVIMHA